MDEIAVRREAIEYDWSFGDPELLTVVIVHVNGEDLRSLVVEPDRADLTARWEQEADLREEYSSLEQWLDPANHIAWLDVGAVAPPSRHWLGRPEEDLAERGRAAVLTCTCLTYGCGGIAARITIRDDVVTWDEFRHANSDTAVLIGPFRFDRAAYEAALAAL